MPTIKRKKPVKSNLTYPVVVSREDATKEFTKRIGYQHNASQDSDVSTFLRTMNAAHELYPDGFSLTQVCRLAEPWALERGKVLELWEHYRTIMISMGKLAEVSTCLDEQMFAAVR